jgi:acyl-CoA synthetase (AMP-forming)/AMP-acid ligase II
VTDVATATEAPATESSSGDATDDVAAGDGAIVSLSTRETKRWRGVTALSLLAAAVGAVLTSPTALLLAVLGVAYAAYGQLFPAPSPSLRVERTVEAEDPDPGDEVDVTLSVTNEGAFLPDLRVVDEDGNDVPRDGQTIGEIVVRGNQVMDRYLGKPEATEEAFNDRVEGYYHMGDLATVDENGMIRIQDRKKDIIISGGENISSIELEDVLFEHPNVSDVAVIPSPSEQWGETPKAFVVPESGDPDDAGATSEELRAFVRERVATYKTPGEVEFVAELPTTATGKIQPVRGSCRTPKNTEMSPATITKMATSTTTSSASAGRRSTPTTGRRSARST